VPNGIKVPGHRVCHWRVFSTVAAPNYERIEQRDAPLIFKTVDAII